MMQFSNACIAHYLFRVLTNQLPARENCDFCAPHSQSYASDADKTLFIVSGDQSLCLLLAVIITVQISCITVLGVVADIPIKPRDNGFIHLIQPIIKTQALYFLIKR